jgi:protein-tyrosine phosphatase
VTGRHSEPTPFAVLFVCSGNICRSPLAEQVFRARADSIARERLEVSDASTAVTFASAGVWAREGDTMTEQAADLSIHYGGRPSDHRAKRLTRDLVDSADLVLGLTREHRKEIVQLQPRASRMSFTLNEFARLFENLRADSGAVDELQQLSESNHFLQEVVASVASRRGLAPPADAALDDIVDPYNRSRATYERAAAAIVAAMDSIYESLELSYSKS